MRISWPVISIIGLVIIYYVIKYIEKRVENTGEFVHFKKTELEDIIRRFLNNRIELKEFEKCLREKFELHPIEEESIIDKLLFSRFARYNSLEDVLNKSANERKLDNVKYLLLAIPILDKFKKSEMDESEFYKHVRIISMRCKKHTWDIKVFEDGNHNRDFYLEHTSEL